ncbi:MAG: hypothetical protein LBB91_06575, partial [Clostridiales bacterium]|nr:hypothetical protein [Clostridiales bacterium]
MTRKIKEILIILLVLALTLAACSGGGSFDVSLDSMKKAVSDAGYKAEDDFFKSNDDITDGFSVIYPRKNSDAYIPVYEMRDKAAAFAYAENINASGSNLALVNDKFLAVVS